MIRFQLLRPIGYHGRTLFSDMGILYFRGILYSIFEDYDTLFSRDTIGDFREFEEALRLITRGAKAPGQTSNPSPSDTLHNAIVTIKAAMPSE